MCFMLCRSRRYAWRLGCRHRCIISQTPINVPSNFIHYPNPVSIKNLRENAVWYHPITAILLADGLHIVHRSHYINASFLAKPFLFKKKMENQNKVTRVSNSSYAVVSLQNRARLVISEGVLPFRRGICTSGDDGLRHCLCEWCDDA